ncbi:MAG: CBM21 domain-containing protein [Lachnospiraceae bacterium]|nr:CBM21 domain-containing protein [Lachnospiraceae bacterium]
MKIGKFLKETTIIMLVFAMLLGVFAISDAETAVLADDNPVKMYCCDSVINWRGSVEYIVYIQIDADSAANKEVSVHYSTGTSAWQDAEATYVTHLDNQTEIWKATVSGFGIGGEYAIKYIGDGKTYWDNNNGQNYTATDVLGQANIIVDRLQYQQPNSYTIKAIVRNLGYNKVIKVLYTQDNWATYNVAAFNYQSPYQFNTDLEVWSVTLNLDENKMDSFQYCVSYEVNGETYWDNNFGANYDRNHYLPLGY